MFVGGDQQLPLNFETEFRLKKILFSKHVELSGLR